jgi:protease-4
MTEGNNATPFQRDPAGPPPIPERVVYVSAAAPARRGIFRSILVYVGSALVVFSVILNFALLSWVAAVSGGAGDDLQEKYVSGSASSARKVVVIDVSGLIMEGSGGLFSVGGDFQDIVRQLKKAREDEKVAGVLLEVNSPGGSVTASDILLHEVELVKGAKKKVVVWMGSLAASGGYYISCKADTIFATPTTLTGSIGVVMSLYNLEGLSEKVGFRSVLIKRGEFKDMGSPFREMTDDERKKFDLLADSAYDRFKQVIRDGRGKKLTKDVDQLANGAVITSQEALLDGLIDSIGYLEDAMEEVKGKYPDAAVVRYHRPTGLLSALIAESNAPSHEIHVHLDSPLPALTAGLYYLWTPGAAVRP